MKWLLLALAVPVIELASLVAMTRWIGGAATFGLVIVAMVLGFLVMRAGVRRLRVAARDTGSAGQARAANPITWTEPLVMIGAGVLLLLPGFVGDAIALLLLIPGVRLILLGLIGVRLARRFPSATVTLTSLRIAGGGPIVPGETIDPPQP
jgi:UPF0716 protein FxsA